MHSKNAANFLLSKLDPKSSLQKKTPNLNSNYELIYDVRTISQFYFSYKKIYSSADPAREKNHENRSCFHLAANLYNYFDPCYRSASVAPNLFLFGAEDKNCLSQWQAGPSSMTHKLDSPRPNHVMLSAVTNYNHCPSSTTDIGNYFFQPVFLKILFKNVSLYIQRRMDLCSTVKFLQ